MVDQEFVDQHAARIDAVSANFLEQLTQVMEGVRLRVNAKLLSALTVDEGWVTATPENSSAIRGIDRLYSDELKASNYHTVVLAFVSMLSLQMGEFQAVYARAETEYPRLKGLFKLTDDDAAVLADQAGAALQALETKSMDAVSALRNLSSRSLGGVLVSDLIEAVSDSIRKVSEVEQMGRDQLTTFFRLVGNLVYSNLEEAGLVLLYKVVGVRDSKNRPFCAKLLDADQAYTRAEINLMDNGQIPGVFENVGGYGCRHWFALWLVQ